MNLLYVANMSLSLTAVFFNAGEEITTSFAASGILLSPHAMREWFMCDRVSYYSSRFWFEKLIGSCKNLSLPDCRNVVSAPFVFSGLSGNFHP